MRMCSFCHLAPLLISVNLRFIKVPEKGTQKQKTHKVPILEPMSQETADTEDDDDVNEENEFEEIEEVEETIVSQNGDSSQQGTILFFNLVYQP